MQLRLNIKCRKIIMSKGRNIETKNVEKEKVSKGGG